MSIKITKAQYIQRLKDKNIEIKPTGIYINMGTKMEHICTCGNNFEISPRNVLNGNKCGCGYKKLNKRQNYFEEDYILELKSKKIKVKPLEKFINKSTKINHKCVCGNIWKIVPKNILKGQSCGCKFATNEQHKKELLNNNIKVELLGDYSYKHIPTEYLCTCGNKFTSKPSQVLKGYKCGCRRNYSLRDLNFYTDKKTILYYIKVNNLYKIGITLYDKNIEYSIYKKRFGRDIKNGVSIELIDYKIFNDGSEAFQLEQTIISENKNKKAKTSNILFFGNSELSKENVNPL